MTSINHQFLQAAHRAEQVNITATTSPKPQYRTKATATSIRQHIAYAAVLISFFGSSVVRAQDVEEVIIQGTQVDNVMVDDMVSSVVLDADKLADAGIENVEDVAAYVPNLVLTQTETGTAICIRGICPGTNQGFDQSVGLYSDDVPLPRANMARAPFLDLSGIQVLRGPQYTTDGNYSIAGSIHMITNLNTDEPEVQLDTTYVPAFNESTALLTMGGPINDLFAARFALQTRTGDNYVENVFQPENADREELLGRNVLGFNPSEDLTFKLKLVSGSYKSKGRNVEVIRAIPVPTDFTAGIPLLISPETTASRRCTGPSSASSDCGRYYGRPSAEVPLAAGVLTETDISYTGVANGYDFAFAPGSGGIADLFSNRRPFEFAGMTALETLADIYQRTGAPVPSGLLDTQTDWNRSTNTPETSNNELNNITLNGEYFLGESKLTFVASRIDYNFEEVIDSDFLPVNFLETAQQEDYTQDFFKLTYSSSGDNFLDFKVGASHLKSQLEFRDQTTPFIDFIPLNNSTWTTPSDPNYISVEDSTLSYFFARAASDSATRFISDLALSREFSSDTEIDAAFLEATLNWNDQIRMIAGARYTRSTKSARRELCWLDEQTGEKRTGAIDVTALSITRNAFGVEFHCDEQFGAESGGTRVIKPSLVGSRVDETLLPSIVLEWTATESMSFQAGIRMGSKVGGYDARSLSTPLAPGVDNNSIGANNLPVLGSFEFEDELAITYEIGAKWFLPIGQLYATAFFTEFTDLQTSRGDGRIGQNVGNASAAETAGIEIEGQLSLTDRLMMNLSLAYTEFEFKDFKFGACALGRRPDYFYYAGEIAGQDNFVDNPRLLAIGADPILTDSFREILYPGDTYILKGVEYTYSGRDPSVGRQGVVDSTNQYSGKPYTGPAQDDPQYFEQAFAYDQNAGFGAKFCDFSGQTNQYVADWQATVTFDYMADIADFAVFHPTLDVLYNSGYHTSLNQDARVYQDAYTQLNGRLALESFDGIWETAIVFENITNEKIIGNATVLPLTSQLHASPAYAGFIRAPRSIGLNLRYSFF